VDTASDVLHCGDCGAPCAPSEDCIGGVCTLVCAPGFEPCGGECVNPATDVLHCGGCDQPCAPGLVCNGGDCAADCDLPLLTCNMSSCVDADHDPDNCGACGLPCPPVQNAEPVCLPGGICTRSRCDPGTGDCNGLPFDGCEAVFASDPLACGGCGIVCNMGQSCVGGACL
jgi:hypothetical protein